MGTKRPCFENLSVRGCKLLLLPTLCLVRISGFWLKVNFYRLDIYRLPKDSFAPNLRE